MSNILLIIIVLVMALLAPSQGVANNSTLSGLSTAHARVMNDPGNLEFLYEYAREAIRLGNYEAAIGALESMLIIAGNQPRLLLEIGTLYQRLDAPKTAQFYLRRARKYADKGAGDSATAKRYLTTARKQISDHSLTGLSALASDIRAIPVAHRRLMRFCPEACLFPGRSPVIPKMMSMPSCCHAQNIGTS